MKLFRINFLIIVTLLSFSSFSQVITEVITLNNDLESQDAMVGSSGLVNVKLGNSPYLNVNVYHYEQFSSRSGRDVRRTETIVYRSFVEFDLDNIPSNATIVEAKLMLTPKETSTQQNFNYNVRRVTSNWSSDNIVWNNQSEDLLSQEIKIYHPNSSSRGVHEIDVTRHVQDMLIFPERNFGWKLSLENERLTGSYGVNFYSSNYSNVSKRPKLVIKYVIPISLTGNTTHCSNGNSDGGVAVSLIGGSGNYTEFKWLKFVSGNTSVVKSGTNISDVNISNVSAGLYMLEVKDDKSNSVYKYFLIGEEGVTTTVDIFANDKSISSQYNEDVLVSNGNGDVNFSTNPYNYVYDQNDFEMRTLIAYNLDFDNNLTFSKANYRLFSPGTIKHYTSTGTSDETVFSRITSSWLEDKVTFNNKPSISETDKIVNSGAGTGYFLRNDIIDISNFVKFWQTNPEQNFGFEMAFSSYLVPGFRRIIYGSSDYNSSLYRPKLTLSFEVKSVLTSSFDETTNKGSIVVEAPEGQLPYTYLIGHNSLPKMESLWRALKDSIGMDSISFYRGRTNNHSFKFDHLTSGRYFVGIYDNTGEKIYDKDIYVGPKTVVYESFDLIENGNQLSVKPGSNSGFATMFALIEEDKIGGFEFEITNYNDDVIFGFNREFDTIPYVDSLFEYAIKVLRNKKIILLKSGIEIWNGSSNLSERLRLIKQNGKITFVQSNDIVVDLDDYNNLHGNYKIVAGLKGANSLLLKPLIIGFVKPNPIKIGFENPICPKKEAEVSINFPLTFFKYQNYNYTLTNVSTGFQMSGTSNSAVTLSLPIGPYVLTSWYSSYSGGAWSSVFMGTSEFTIGHTVDWTSFNNVTSMQGTVNSIGPSNFSNLATAVSYNQSNLDVTNWIEFNWKGPFDNIPPYTIYNNTWVDVSLKNDVLLPLTRVRVYNPGFGVVSGFVNVMSNGLSITNFIANNAKPIRLEFSTTSSGITDNVKIVHDGNDWTHSVTPSVTGVLKVFPELKGKVILENTISSFCGANYVHNYSDLTKKLDGGYYLSKKGIVKFIYNEEYKDLDGNLTYTIVNSDNQEVVSSVVLTQPVHFGDNRYTLNFSCLSPYSLPNGFYVLIVTNEKKESFYLRIKVIDNC